VEGEKEQEKKKLQQTAYAASAPGKRENAQSMVLEVGSKQTVSHATKCRHTP